MNEPMTACSRLSLRTGSVGRMQRSGIRGFRCPAYSPTLAAGEADDDEKERHRQPRPAVEQNPEMSGPGIILVAIYPVVRWVTTRIQLNASCKAL